ncbi:MAG TPA: hypothetical protein VMZ91_02735 [Candidatus Paceibacterota bacterium]|nr:hypothetical protein [Candidatus Paceibacterota bacterium]
MPKYIDLKTRKDGEIITVGHHAWFLKFLNKFREGRESWEQIAMRLITSRKLDPEHSKKLKQEIANYDKFL